MKVRSRRLGRTTPSPRTATTRALAARDREPPGRSAGSGRARSSPPTRPARCPTASSGSPTGPSSTSSTCSRTRRGTGLHVGHPLGYIGTDVYARYKRMTGHNVLHAMGYDAFGLPAEQYAVQTGQHPRVTTEDNIANMRRQLGRLGLGHDPRRSVATTDVVVLPVDPVDLPADLRLLVRPRRRPGPADRRARGRARRRHPHPPPGTNPSGSPWADLSPVERRKVVDAHRLAYLARGARQLVPGPRHRAGQRGGHRRTARSERGNFPVFRRPLKQWMMRITAYADRLIADLDLLDWPESIKAMQRNWIGRSEGAQVHFGTSRPPSIAVFTTRPDTLFGATYMVLAPEHPLVDELVADAWPADVDPRVDGGRRRRREPRSRPTAPSGPQERARPPERGPREDRRLHRRLGHQPGQRRADPRVRRRLRAHGLRHRGDHGRARSGPARLGLRRRCSGCPSSARSQPPRGLGGRGVPRRGTGDRRRSFLDGLAIPEAKARDHRLARGRRASARAPSPTSCATGSSPASATGASPSRSSTTSTTCRSRCPRASCPCSCPRSTTTRRATLADRRQHVRRPSPRSAGRRTGSRSTLDLGDGPKVYRREVNTMPQWAGSCWYELRYLDPTNENAFVDPEVERYWMGPQHDGDPGGVDLYVGGVEHAVLHLLYARFWHKVLFDLGHAQLARAVPPAVQPGLHPGRRVHRRPGLLRRGRRGRPSATARTSTASTRGAPRVREDGQVAEELGHARRHVRASTAPTRCGSTRCPSGPLDQSRPWETKAVVGVFRLLQRIWRNVLDEEHRRGRAWPTRPPDDETRRILHRTIAAVRDDMDALRFNTAIARIYELNNHLTGAVPRRRRAARGGRGPRPAAGPAGPARRRGAVVAPGPRPVAGVGAVPRGRPGPPRRGRRSRCRCRSTAR